MLDRIEIFRGNAPERADRLGIGGAVFFEPRLPRRPALRAGVGVGSFGELGTWAGAEVADGGGHALSPASALAAVRRSHTDQDYEFLDDRGTVADTDDRLIRRPNADSADFDVWTLGRVSLGRSTRLFSVVNVFEREQGVTGIALLPAQRARGRIQRLLAGLSARLPCARRSLGAEARCQLELSTSMLFAKSALFDPAGELSLGAPQVTSAGERFTQRVAVAHGLGEVSADALVGPPRLAVSVVQENELLRVERQPGGLDARRIATRLALTLTTPLSRRLELHGIGALSRHATSASRSEAEPLLPAEGRLGARFAVVGERAAPGRLDFVANLARTTRVPTLGELYGTSALVRGNEELVPEIGVGGDIGLRAAVSLSHRNEAWLDAFVFGRSVSDLIAYRRSGLGFVRPFNVGRARMLGAELAAGADALEHLRYEVSLTALDPRDVSEGRSVQNDLVPYLARLVVWQRLELYAEPEQAPLSLGRASVAASFGHRSSRVADPAGLVVLDDELVTDLELSLRFWQQRLAVRFAVENVFDARRFDAVGFPLPGRSLHAAGELWLW